LTIVVHSDGGGQHHNHSQSSQHLIFLLHIADMAGQDGDCIAVAENHEQGGNMVA
jgi:hypothetical protein